MKLTLIAAMDPNRVIGKDNDLIWHFPKDLKHFKTKTSGHSIVMGRKTYESVGKPLPKRRNIVITRQKDYSAQGIEVVNSLEEALSLTKGEDEVYIVGGAEVYKLALSKADRMELTFIEKEYEGDSFFPNWDESNWEITSTERHEADESHEAPFTFVQVNRIK